MERCDPGASGCHCLLGAKGCVPARSHGIIWDSSTQLGTVTPRQAHGTLPIPPTAAPKCHHPQTAAPSPMARTDFPLPKTSPPPAPHPSSFHCTLRDSSCPQGLPPTTTRHTELRFKGTSGPPPAQPLATGVTPPPPRCPHPFSPAAGGPRGGGRAVRMRRALGVARCGAARPGSARLDSSSSSSCCPLPAARRGGGGMEPAGSGPGAAGL